MVFTINQYLKNPMGSGSAIMPSESVKAGYRKAFVEVRSQMNCYWYKVKDKWICHITIPSKSAEGMKYDVIFDFGDISEVKDLKEASIKVFSNSPSFIFTYAKAFKDHDILIDWLEDKYVNKVLASDPGVRNQFKVISYEKSLYLACLYFQNNRSIDVFARMNALEFDSLDKVKDRIKSERALKNQRNRAQKKLKKAKEEAKKKGKSEAEAQEQIERDKGQIHSSEDIKPDNSVPKKTPKTKKTQKLTNKVPKTPKTKKTKKI